MPPRLPLPLAVALSGALALDACGGRNPPAPADAAAARDLAPDLPPTAVGRACSADAECAGLVCVTRLQRMCLGPIRPHTWSWEFPGGWCHPPIDLNRGVVPGGCPPGSSNLTVLVGCDGIPFRFCTRPCAADVDCRAAEGYRCNRESSLCYPPALVTEEPDAGAGADAAGG
jgi:hypothetical protein